MKTSISRENTFFRNVIKKQWKIEKYEVSKKETHGQSK